ncbi:MAG: Na(+)/H(+) antiporter subunit D [Deltaproteobacteria bacterium]|nr:MAG: Na(+)/H(+) antiporter subunit D [Deltaproteobacteria bacterium]
MINAPIFMHPAAVFFAGAFLMPFFKKNNFIKPALVIIPLIAIFQINFLPSSFGNVNYLGFELIFGRLDSLSYVFLNVFTLMALIAGIYSSYLDEWEQHSAALVYAGSSLGVTLAGDYLTLFIFWELMAFSSVFLVWYRKKRRSHKAGLRYLIVHATGGLVLLAGILIRYHYEGNFLFTPVPPESAGLGDYLIMVGFMLNAAVPPIHAWLPDAYPEASVIGAVYMCAYTTKTAVYTLARGFAGFEALVIFGAVMTLYGVGYAVIENDSRRILAYHIVSQVGYMVCAVGIGTSMAINGACAHAYAHILYKALLFMGVGAVVEMTGKSKLSELGGMYSVMPVSLVMTVIGGIAISGFPLTSGFISKSMIVSAAGEAHRPFIMIMLLLASVGTFLSVGIKLPYFIWFNKTEPAVADAKEAYSPMLGGMAIAAFFCIMMGVYPEYLYRMLPYEVHYHPYTMYHLSETLQIIGFTGLGFYLMRKKLAPEDKLNLDVDWFYRKAANPFKRFCGGPLSKLNDIAGEIYKTVGIKFTMLFAKAMSWFDWNGIDYVIDSSAKETLNLGDKVKMLTTGKIQQYIGIAVVIFFGVLIVVVLF